MSRVFLILISSFQISRIAMALQLNHQDLPSSLLPVFWQNKRHLDLPLHSPGISVYASSFAEKRPRRQRMVDNANEFDDTMKKMFHKLDKTLGKFSFSKRRNTATAREVKKKSFSFSSSKFEVFCLCKKRF